MEKSEKESDIGANGGGEERMRALREKISSKVSPEASTASPLFHTISSHFLKEDNYPQDIQQIQRRIMFKLSRSLFHPVTVKTQYSYIVSPNRRLSIRYCICDTHDMR